MVKSCRAIGCGNEWTPSSSVRYHRFPLKRPEILDLWLQALGLENTPINAHTVICSDHFTPDSYMKSSSRRKMLKEDAVPSKFPLKNERGISINCDARIHTESSMEEVPVNNADAQIKKEMEEIDCEEYQVVSTRVKVERHEGDNDKFEFISVESNSNYLGEKNKLTDPPGEQFEEVRLKEEIDSISLYCKMCKIQFDHKDKLVEHSMLHTKRHAYFCSVCLEVFKRKNDILRHFKEHKNIQLLSKCNLCNYTFGSKEDLDLHTKTFEHIRQLSCNECGKEFFLKRNLTIHKRLHTNKIFKCNICLQKFARQLFLDNHMMKHDNKKIDVNRRDDEANNPISKCPQYNFTGNSQREIKKHKKIHLTDRIKYKCELCSYETGQKIELAKHQAVHFDVRSHECYICKARFGTKANLTRHIKSHSEGSFECDLCKKTFTMSKYLKDHMKRHVDKDLFECEMCDFKCYHKYDLNKHQVETNHKKLHRCEVCKKEFAMKESYKLHLSLHGGAEKYECISCDYKFVLSRQLWHHMKSAHPYTKPLKCDLCQYSTFVTLAFERHKLRHKEIKPYVCKICKVGFDYNYSMKKHMTSHFGLNPYKCKICGNKYSTYDTLKRHKLIHARSTSEKAV